jgi:hypothetical protein
VEIFFQDTEDIKSLGEMGLPLEEGYVTKDKSIIFFVSENQFSKIQQSGFGYKVLIDDWGEHYRKRQSLSRNQKQQVITNSRVRYGVQGFEYGSMGGFYTIEEVYSELDSMFQNYSNIITEKYSIGQTLEEREIYVAKISDNPNVDEDEPEVFLNSLIHAREPQGMMTLMYYMYYLLENYGTDPEVTYLVDNREIYFLPIMNVDGYQYNIDQNPAGGGMWRKNRRENEDGSYGVDLNRNWGYKWGYDDVGSSPDPSDATYRGTDPFSEPAAQVVKEFVENRNFKTALNYHTYSNLLIFPWGYINKETPDSAVFRDFASDMTAFNGYTYGTSGDILYEVNGDTDDWMYGEQNSKNKIISMTPEVGGYSDGFWPAQSRIYPLAQENLEPNLYITWAAGGFVNLVKKEFSQSEFNPGDEVILNVEIKNKGLSALDDINFELRAVDEKAKIIEGKYSIDSLKARTSMEMDHDFTFKIDKTTQVEDVVELEFVSYAGDIPMSSDTIKLNIGTPIALFENKAEDLSVWEVTSNNSFTSWDTTHSEFYSDSSAFTESPNGIYSNNASTTLTLTEEIELPADLKPKLGFWTKFDIESDWDCGQVEITSDGGSSWKAIGGEHSNIGTGDGEQPQGEPVYDGIQNIWVYEVLDLEEYAGENVKLRFTFNSDTYITQDGWYIDDIKVFYYALISSADSEQKQPLNFALEQNYPNPFNPSTRISYTIPKDNMVSLKIFNTLGQKIAEVVNEYQKAGNYSVNLSTENLNLSSGIYFYKLETGKYSQTKKMVILQ